MKKIIVALFFLTVLRFICHAQDQKFNIFNVDSLNIERRDSLLHGLNTARQDTSRVLFIAELANYHLLSRPDSAFFYGYKALTLARQIKFPKGEAVALRYIGIAHLLLGNVSKALQTGLQGLKFAEKNNLMLYKAFFLAELGQCYFWGFENYTKALDHFKKSKALFDSLNDSTNSTFHQFSIGVSYSRLNQLDSALYYCESAYKNAVQLNVGGWLIMATLLILGEIQNKVGILILLFLIIANLYQKGIQ